MAICSSHCFAKPKVSSQYINPNVKEIIVVYKTHFDIGFTDMPHKIVHKYRTTMIDNALKVCDQNKGLPAHQQFVWTIPGWPMKKILEDWKGQNANRRDRVRNAFRDGRFVTHGLAFTTHTELLEPEELVRSLVFSSNISREFGLELPRDAKMTDVPVHTWIVPTLCKHAGIDFLHIGTNPASGTAKVPLLFYWEGPDGSQVLTMYAPGSYGSGLFAPENWPYKTWLALIHTNDNQGPPGAHTIGKLFAQAGRSLPGVKVRIGRLSDFADCIRAEKAEIPVVKMDMPDTWIHGPMASPIGAKIAHNLRPKIAASEFLTSLLKTWGIERPDPTKTLADAYEQSLLYSEHTWGGDGHWIGYKTPYGKEWRDFCAKGMSPAVKRLVASWEAHRRYIDDAKKLTEPQFEESLAALAKNVKTDGGRVVVFNSLPWERSGLVSIERDGKKITFMATKVPPMGYKTYAESDLPKDQPKTPATKGKVIENKFFKVTIDPETGTVSSLIDKSVNRELVDTSSKNGFGQYLYERFSKKNINKYLDDNLIARPLWAIRAHGKPYLPETTPYSSASPAKFDVKIEHNKIDTTIMMQATETGTIEHGVTLKIVLYNDSPMLDIEIGIVKKLTEPWPEAGWLCLPLKVNMPKFRLSRVGSVIDPAKDIVTGGNRDIITLNGGMAAIDPEGNGIGICPLDSPLVSIERPGLWKFSKEFVPKKSDIFVNLHNNMWNCNFRLWNEGSWTSRVRLWTFKKYDEQRDLITPGLETRTPLFATYADGKGGNLPTSRSGISLSMKGVLVTGFGPNPFGEGQVLRLWELAGQDGKCQVTLPEGMNVKSVQPCDLRGRKNGEPVTVKDGKFNVEINHFAPVSFLINN